METLKQLLDRYTESNKVEQISSLVHREEAIRLQLSGVIGAQEAFIIGGVFLKDPAYHLVIGNDKEDAAYLQNNIADLLEEQTIQN